MKTLREKVIFPRGTSFEIYRRSEEKYDFTWHIHPEYEIVYIHEGFGKRYVGNSVEEYSAPEVVFIPPEIPHTWESDPASLSNEACVIHFKKDCLGENWIDHNEFNSIQSLMNSKNAWLIKQNADTLFSKAVNANGLLKLAAFIELFDWINNVDKISLGHYVLADEGANTRLEKVLNWLNDNFRGDFTVRDLADKMSMSPYQLRSLFQKHIGKSVLQHTNELKVFEACKLMQNHDSSISHIADMSGFKNLSYFNRTFLKITGMTPRNYRRQFIFVDSK